MGYVSTIPQTLYIHLHFNTILTTRTEGQNLEIFDHNSALVDITELQGTVRPQTDTARNCCTYWNHMTSVRPKATKWICWRTKHETRRHKAARIAICRMQQVALNIRRLLTPLSCYTFHIFKHLKCGRDWWREERYCCPCPCHKGTWGCRGEAPLILHLGTRWRCVADKVALGQPFLRATRLSPVKNIPPLLHATRTITAIVTIYESLNNTIF